MMTPRKERSRADQLAVTTLPDYFVKQSETRSPWFESADEIRRGLARGKQKAQLLRWVRLHAGKRLTARERECLEQHFLQGIAIADIAAQTYSNAASVHRTIRRSIRKLRCAAQKARLRVSGRLPRSLPAENDDDCS